MAVAPPPEDTGVSPEFLRDHCGVSDLTEVTCLELELDASSTRIASVGEHLPFIVDLKLSGSRVPEIRDLGTSFGRVQVLWLCRCGLVELDGIGSMPLLQELYLSFNELKDLSALMVLEELAVVDLEGNCVQDYKEVETLSLLSLRELTLTDNPVQRAPGYSRQALFKLIPSLQLLDDLPPGADDSGAGALLYDDSTEMVSGTDRTEGSEPGGTWRDEPDENQLIIERLKQQAWRRPLGLSFSARPFSAGTLRHSFDGAQTWSAPPSFRPMTSSGLRRPPGMPERLDEVEDEGGASDLTAGNDVGFSGNPVAAIRHRRAGQSADSAESQYDIRSLLQRYRTFAQPSMYSEEQLEELRLQAASKRPGSANVRITKGRPLSAQRFIEEELGRVPGVFDGREQV